MTKTTHPRDRSRTACAKAHTLQRKGERAARRFTQHLGFAPLAPLEVR